MSDHCVMMRTRLVARTISSIYDDKLRPFGINAAQCSLLVVMVTLGPSRRADIGRFNQLDRSTLSRNLAIMLDNGWIEEVEDRSAGDGRGKPVALSAAGTALLHQVHPAWREAQAEAKAILGRDGAAVISGIGNAMLGRAAARTG